MMLVVMATCIYRVNSIPLIKGFIWRANRSCSDVSVCGSSSILSIMGGAVIKRDKGMLRLAPENRKSLPCATTALVRLIVY